MTEAPTGSQFSSGGAQGVDRGRRARSRLRVRLPVRVVTRTQTKVGILADLSQSGAKIATDALLKVGGEVLLEWGKFEAFGEVVWTRGQYCGVAFFDPISEGILLGTRALDDNAHLPRDTDLLRQAARNWVQGGSSL
ncbi:PilZ domain-containing protein [Novosphingobium clariflavum]|uniref:PilZ domain-containing protein n=1 Tax=Novosphingobium clariflavum TaxID=2029884 RepID=A0ABV6SF75_9SPHN|nr:PilZ domain-containing protein [Novosphingobium clariflavum]